MKTIEKLLGFFLIVVFIFLIITSIGILYYLACDKSGSFEDRAARALIIETYYYWVCFPEKSDMFSDSFKDRIIRQVQRFDDPAVYRLLPDDVKNWVDCVKISQRPQEPLKSSLGYRYSQE